MSVDANNWKPVLNEREDQGIITPMPQSDGSIRYFQGNPDNVGSIDTVRVFEPGKFKKGVMPTVQLIDSEGNDIDHNGASFRVIIDSKGNLTDVEMGMAANGSGFTEDMDIKFVTPNPGDCFVKPSAKALVNTGEWMDNMTADQVEEHNANIRKQHAASTRTGREKNQGTIVGATDYNGKAESLNTVTRGGLQSL